MLLQLPSELSEVSSDNIAYLLVENKDGKYERLSFDRMGIEAKGPASVVTLAHIFSAGDDNGWLARKPRQEHCKESMQLAEPGKSHITPQQTTS